MSKRYSIAQARDNLAAIVHELDRTTSVEITRRGFPVAVLLSKSEYDRLQGKTGGFWEACKAFRAEVDLAEADIDPEKIFGSLRDRSPGRDIQL